MKTFTKKKYDHFLFDKKDDVTILGKKTVNRIKDSLSTDEYSLSFNTKSYHNVKFICYDGIIVNYPINKKSDWKATELIESGKVRKIQIEKISKKEYKVLSKFCDK